jgi:predicted CopG family antitoxin
MNNTYNRQKIEKSHKLTTISISKENYFILKKMGQTSDSFNDVLSRLLKNNSLLESDRS